MKKYTLLFLILFCSIFSFGQKPLIVYSGVLVIVDNYKTLWNNMFIEKEKLELVRMLDDSLGMKKYGDSGRNGVIVFRSLGKPELLRVNEIIQLYKVKEQDTALRVCINKTVIKHPEMLLIQKDMIKTVEITEEHFWVNPSEANSAERFINIVVNY